MGLRFFLFFCLWAEARYIQCPRKSHSQCIEGQDFWEQFLSSNLIIYQPESSVSPDPNADMMTSARIVTGCSSSSIHTPESSCSVRRNVIDRIDSSFTFIDFGEWNGRNSHFSSLASSIWRWEWWMIEWQDNGRVLPKLSMHITPIIQNCNNFWTVCYWSMFWCVRHVGIQTCNIWSYWLISSGQRNRSMSSIQYKHQESVNPTVY